MLDNPLGWRVLKGLKLKTNRQPSNQNPNPSTPSLTLIPNKILSHLLCGAKINKMVESRDQFSFSLITLHMQGSVLNLRVRHVE